VLAKHSKSFSLIPCTSVGVDRIQRNFEPMRKAGDWRRSELTDVTAKVVVYAAFVEPYDSASRCLEGLPFSNSRVVETGTCALVTSCEDFINLIIVGGKRLAGVQVKHP
jgi:hypothetical protein